MKTQSTKKSDPPLGLLRLVAALILVGVLGDLIRPDSILGASWILVLPILGAAFLIWGCWKRSAGEILLGSIISALAVTAVLFQSPLPVMAEFQANRVLVLALGLGFGLTTLLTAVFTDKPRWWTLAVAIVLILAAWLLVSPAVAYTPVFEYEPVWDSIFTTA